MRRTTILHNYFFMNEGGLLSRHVVIGKVLPSVPSQDNAEGYISRNEMKSDYVNVSFFKWKGFHGTFIEQGKSLHVAANIINENKRFGITLKITYSITGHVHRFLCCTIDWDNELVPCRCLEHTYFPADNARNLLGIASLEGSPWGFHTNAFSCEGISKQKFLCTK